MIAGLASALPSSMSAGLIAQGVPAAVANQVSHLPPVGSLFAAFLGYNPMKNLLGPALNNLPAARASYITGKTFFPQLISDPFMHGLRIVFSAAVVMSLVAAAASWLRGQKYVHTEEEAVAAIPAPVPAVPAPVPVPASVEALAATGGGTVLNSSRAAIQAASQGGSDVSAMPEELRGRLSAALLAFSDAQPALTRVQARSSDTSSIF